MGQLEGDNTLDLIYQMQNLLDSNILLTGDGEVYDRSYVLIHGKYIQLEGSQ
jgi:hypothetical protein